jgi:Response regulator receiver domain/Histidine kinase-, DNA gyrase B-, and HSP90-like ATPase
LGAYSSAFIEGQYGRTHEGTGIGLALVQELVKLHRGTIDVDSAVGRGTVFTVRIPLGTAHLPAVVAGAQPRIPSTSVRADAFVREALRWLPDEPSESSGAFDDSEEAEASVELGSGGRVLLADDNADMREYIRRLLEIHCDVRTVADGRAALRDIREHRPNLVLADVMMPNMDGLELLREIRGDAALRDIPVILL